MSFEAFNSIPVEWIDHEDIAIKLYEKFGDDFTESKIYRIRFTQLLNGCSRYRILLAKEKIAVKDILSKSKQNGCTNGEIINNI